MRTQTNKYNTPMTKLIKDRKSTGRKQMTFGRFTTNVENFHGRLAMLGLTGCSLGEIIKKMTFIQQFVTETEIKEYQLTSLIIVTTSIFILEIINPLTMKRVEKELDVFTNPGFNLETEIFHGRMAMLVFAYFIISEQTYNTPVL